MAWINFAEYLSPIDSVHRPCTIAETEFVLDLLPKHLFSEGVLDIQQLRERMALAGTIIETVLDSPR